MSICHVLVHSEPNAVASEADFRSSVFKFPVFSGESLCFFERRGNREYPIEYPIEGVDLKKVTTVRVTLSGTQNFGLWANRLIQIFIFRCHLKTQTRFWSPDQDHKFYSKSNKNVA